ncbi:MAG: ThiF family adenylyltransferase, partial [Myxococcota bacterium]
REYLNQARVGLVGYGGGGSHVGQQLAHVKVPRLTVFEPQTVEDTNLNRLVGAAQADVGHPKLDVARRVLGGLMSLDEVQLLPVRWQDAPEALRACDVVVGCVDSARQRDELERECRKWLIPYIDIGLGITPSKLDGENPLMAGQVVVSLPGQHCLRCYRVVTDDALAMEAANYGDTSPAPQVVWANGVLASLAVGHVVGLLTGWQRIPARHRFLRYDADGCAVPLPDYERKLLPPTCTHYLLKDAGPAVVRKA